MHGNVANASCVESSLVRCCLSQRGRECGRSKSDETNEFGQHVWANYTSRFHKSIRP